MSFPRKRESSVIHWIPAFAGMTKHMLNYIHASLEEINSLDFDD